MKLKDTNQIAEQQNIHIEEELNSPNNKTSSENRNTEITSLDDIAIFKMTSPHLIENPYFMKLKEWMCNFHKEIRDQTTCDFSVHKLLRDNHLKILLYEHLVRLLREIAFTKDPDTQSMYVKRMYDWLMKREKKPERMIWTVQPLKKTQNLPDKQLSMLPSKELYRYNMRTIHSEINPPKNRLLLFDHKPITRSAMKEDTEVSRSYIKTDVTTDLSPIIRKSLAKSADKANSIEGRSNYLYYQPKDPREQKIERLWFSRKNKLIADKRSAMEMHTTLRQWGRAKSRLNGEITRKQENITYGNNYGIRNYINKRLKLVKNSHTKSKRYKESYDKESDEEVSPKKVLSKSYELKPPEIIDLKDDIKKQPLKAPRKKKLPKKVLFDISKAIYEGDKRRVDYVRRIYGKLINETDDNMDAVDSIFISGPKGVNTLSIYNKDVNRSYTDYNPKQSLSRRQPMTHMQAREEFRIRQSKEANNIKEFLARKEVPCTMMSLQRAILMPEDCQEKSMSPENFPKPGSRLFINPFAVKKKGKKKKKKRK